MTFDDQLRRAFETLTDRLRDEISRHVRTVVDELAASAQADRDKAIADAQAEHSQAVADARAEREQAVADVQAQRDQAVAEAHAERDRAIADARAERDQAVADALGQRPVAPAPLAEPATTGDHAAPARLLDAVRAIDGAHTLSDILDALVRAASGEVNHAAVLLVRDGGYTGWRSIGFDPPFDRGEAVELPPGAPVLPIAIAGQAVAVLYAETQNSELRTQNSDESTPNPVLEILVRHAARCLESVTAFKAARAALATGAAGAPGGATDEASADEDAAARRYARLLVSEIKLYHESDVMAGRRERDLASRLGGEIARARVLYEQRVPPQIRQHADYFHDELVRTLANGDPALLVVRT